MPRESHHNFWEIESRHSEGRAPHAGGNGQRVHRECSCGNRLNKLVIHTPTAACGSQKEKEKKKICHYGEVKRSLFLQMFPGLFFRAVCKKCTSAPVREQAHGQA